MVTFGTKASEVPEQGDEAVGSYIKYFPKDGDYTLRIMEEVGDWTRYYEHFNPVKSRTFPCTGDRDSCPGCTSENEKMKSASKRYLTNALNPETGYVDLYKIPTSIKGDFDRFSDKDNGTIQARDYTVVRYEDEGRTKYSVDREDRHERDMTTHRQHMRDHQEALAEAYIEVWGGLPGAEQEQERPKVVSITRSASTAEREMLSNGKPKFEDPPSEPASDPKVSAEQESLPTEISEDALRAMKPDELRALFVRIGLRDPGDGKSVDQLTDQLIEILA